ncbi:hypothetical protein CR513_54615, partial [Mucuna pruriens]
MVKLQITKHILLSRDFHRDLYLNLKIHSLEVYTNFTTYLYNSLNNDIYMNIFRRYLLKTYIISYGKDCSIKLNNSCYRLKQYEQCDIIILMNIKMTSLVYVFF